ncbi:hypothetical protein HanRHA438_Chr03g0115041 [Helianthus annuus]|nr:hypothetical protein HanRHA438_Chr03g0115041 [Helianthus annuus]
MNICIQKGHGCFLANILVRKIQMSRTTFELLAMLVPLLPYKSLLRVTTR